MGTTKGIALALCAGLATSGCYGGIQGFQGDDPGSEGGTAESGGDESGEPTPDVDALECEEGPSVAATPLRRLTRLEYDNTVRDLLGDTSQPARGFTPDELMGGYAANAIAKLSKSQLDEYVAVAETLAHTAVDERWDALVGCDADGPGCVESFVAAFGRRAFRRPLDETQRAEYLTLYEDAAAQWGAVEGVALVIQAMLLSPHFLYHVETEGTPGVAALEGFALASRMSYFLWASMPDDALLDMAEAGGLDEVAGIEEQARRMLDDPRAADTIASFHRQWLHLEGLPDLVRDAALFPEWDASLGASMEQETLRFVDEVVRRGDGSLQTLLTASWTMADPSLAELYGVAGPSDGFARVELPTDERAGLLTHASFLTSTSHAAESSWVLRGKFVRERLLCQELPAPPPGVEINEVNDPNRLENPECSGCHTLMDPVGIGFDAYTPIGAFEPEGPDGAPLPVNGEVKGVAGLGEFEGPLELAGVLAENPQVHDCVAQQWFRYASRRMPSAADDCSLDEIRSAFSASGQDIRELMVAIAVSDALRFQLTE